MVRLYVLYEHVLYVLYVAFFGLMCFIRQDLLYQAPYGNFGSVHFTRL